DPLQSFNDLCSFLNIYLSADVQGVVTTSEKIIKVTEGSDVTLPCSITGNIESKRFDWKKDGQKEVYVYDAGPSSSKTYSGQYEQFKGRVSHFSGELKNGNASIMIRNTKVADSGNYTCEFQHLPNQKFLMKLLVGECFHHTADYLQMRLFLCCVGVPPTKRVNTFNFHVLYGQAGNFTRQKLKCFTC
uniref:Ig-like domain-containing protein n=1 Tax=Seriola dumerili TaxID=41447 RepID=A0A3B4T6Q0_SERDU